MSTRARQNEPVLWPWLTIIIATALPRAHSRRFSDCGARAQPRAAERMTSLGGCSVVQLRGSASLFLIPKRLGLRSVLDHLRPRPLHYEYLVHL